MRLYRGGEISHGSACAACGERRRTLLKLVKLGDPEPIPLCGNCVLVLSRTRPSIASVNELRRRAARERRGAAERRAVARGGRRRTDRLAPAAPKRPVFDPGVD
jgi:hypothetical protein